MNFKDLLLPLSLALLTTWGIHHFFFKQASQDGQQRSGQSFIAPKTKQESKPLNTVINFNENVLPKPAQLSTINTDGATLIFSTDGGALERLEYKHLGNCLACPIQTIEAHNDRLHKAFLMALGEDTPYYYELVHREDMPDNVELFYRASYADVIIEKKYTVHTHTYKIDLTITINAKNAEMHELEPRLFFISPSISSCNKSDTISAIYDENGSVEKTARDKLVMEKGWLAPRLFGTESKYFIQALIDDKQGFVQRAYYTRSDNNILVSILEGPTVKQTKPQTWQLSFYFGPKQIEAIKAVDDRLEQTLDYSGFFGPLSRFLLEILNFLYNYLKNYGLAIIVLTLLVKLALLPFSYRADEGLQKKQEFDKKYKYIQQKYKDDPERLRYEREELVKKHGLPGASGFLIMFLQLPLFVALSRVLSSALELYKAPFFGWIHDLSVPDPYYILPILMGVGIILQSRTTNDPKQKMISVMMALAVGAVFTNFAAGLVLYISTFTLLGVVQTHVLKFFKRS